jgi:hypothetical protein
MRSRQAYWQPYANVLGYLVPTVDTQILRAMRQALPIFDTAVHKLVQLTGTTSVVWDSERVQAEWDAWAETVKVAPLSLSFNRWLNGQMERAWMFGTGATEIVLAESGKDVYGFQYVAPSTLRMRPDPDNPMDVIVAQQQTGKPEPVVLDRDFVALNVNDPEDESPYGQSIFAHCPFIAELSIEMAHALKQDWNRTGAPSFAVTVKVPDGLAPGSDVGKLMNTMLTGMQEAWTNALTSRKQGKDIVDFVAAGEINVQTIGADGQRLEFEIPWRSALEQIVAVTHLPPWMLGLHWSTTERLSDEQAQALQDIICDYQAEYTPTVLWAADWWARVRGYGSVGRVAQWPETSLRDRVELARADLIEAQAQATEERTAMSLWRAGVYDQQAYAVAVTDDESVEIATPMDEPPAQVAASPFGGGGGGGGVQLAASTIKATGCTCGHSHKGADDLTPSHREEPSDARIATAITNFHGAMTSALRNLKRHTWRIFELPQVTRDAAQELPPFSMTDDQIREFNGAVSIFLDKMIGRDRSQLGFTQPSNDAVIPEYERFAHQLGVNRATEMTAADAAQLTGDANAAAQRQLLENAFARLSENGQMRLEGQLDELRQILVDSVGEGANPLDVARDMSDRFDQYERYEFERLCRTEVGFAQVAGQIDEFQAEGVDTSGVDGDAPPFHVNCLCSLTVEQDDAGGWRAVYDIAATACELCQEYAGGAQ